MNENNERMTVAITGAAGGVGSQIRPVIAEFGFRAILVDTTAITELGSNETFHQQDVLDTQELTEAIAGADILIHLAGIPTESPWDKISRVNIHGTYSALEACRHAGVPRILIASSNHVVGARTVQEVRDGESSPLPDTYYGTTKAAAEALGGLYAARFGLISVSVRIGSILPRPFDARTLSTWMSATDFVRLVDAVLALREPAQNYMVWGVSANTRAVFPLAPGAQIGFTPQDDSQQVADQVDLSQEWPPTALIGGVFTQPDHPVGGEW